MLALKKRHFNTAEKNFRVIFYPDDLIGYYATTRFIKKIPSEASRDWLSVVADYHLSKYGD